MHETSHAYFHLDHPADGTALLCGSVRLRKVAAQFDSAVFLPCHTRLAAAVATGQIQA